MATFSARISAIRQETPTVKSFTLDYGNQAFTFLPGQWIELYVETDGEIAVGSYSITSSPAKRGTFELAIKEGMRHPVTQHLHQHAKAGDIVRISGGQGVFVFERGMSTHLVLIGAGVGITPLMSILRYVDETAPEVQTTLIYSISTPAEFLFRDELAAMAKRNPNFRKLVTFTQSEPDQDKWLQGRINQNMLSEADLSPDALYYLCGSQQMLEGVTQDLRNLGIPDSKIIYEKWW